MRELFSILFLHQGLDVDKERLIPQDVKIIGITLSTKYFSVNILEVLKYLWNLSNIVVYIHNFFFIVTIASDLYYFLYT